MLFRAYLHGGGGPQVGEVTRGGSPHLSCKCDQIEMSDYMDGRVTPPMWVTYLGTFEAHFSGSMMEANHSKDLFTWRWGSLNEKKHVKRDFK